MKIEIANKYIPEVGDKIIAVESADCLMDEDEFFTYGVIRSISQENPDKDPLVEVELFYIVDDDQSSRKVKFFQSQENVALIYKTVPDVGNGWVLDCFNAASMYPYEDLEDDEDYESDDGDDFDIVGAIGSALESVGFVDMDKPHNQKDPGEICILGKCIGTAEKVNHTKLTMTLVEYKPNEFGRELFYIDDDIILVDVLEMDFGTGTYSIDAQDVHGNDVDQDFTVMNEKALLK